MSLYPSLEASLVDHQFWLAKTGELGAFLSKESNDR